MLDRDGLVARPQQDGAVLLVADDLAFGIIYRRATFQVVVVALRHFLFIAENIAENGQQKTDSRERTGQIGQNRKWTNWKNELH